MSNINPATGLPFGQTWTTDNSPATVPAAANGYIAVPVTADPYQLAADAFAFIAEQIPGWAPAEGHLETWLIYAVARMATVAAQTASQMPVSAFSYFGGTLLGITPNQGAQAETTTTWTMADSKGYTVPAGTVIGFQTSGNSTVLFQTVADFTVPPGQTSTAGGAVTVKAVTAGAAANGLAAGAMILVDQLTYVATVTSTAVTSGGADTETTAAYLNRLSGEMRLLTPRPILAGDYAALAATQAGVARALAVNGLNPYANLLVSPDDSFETGVGTFTAQANCTLSQSSTWAGSGTFSLKMVATAAGTMTARSGWYPVSAGMKYWGLGTFHAGATACPAAVDLVWADINFTVLSTTAGAATNDSTTGGVSVTNSGTAPSNAAYVKIQPNVTAASAGGVHYFDEAGLFLDSGVTPTWAPGGQTTGQQRMVTVIPVDVNGNPLTSTEMTSIAAYLAALREINFVVNVVAPTYTAVTVTATVAVDYGADPVATGTAVTAALDAFLNPGTWAGGGETPPVWLNDTVVRYLSVAGIIENVAGVHHIVSLTVNGGTTDVTLAGYAPLPKPTVNLTASVAAQGT